MNYKIRITAENQAIVKRIADENGIKFNSFDDEKIGSIFLIVNNEITYYYSTSESQKATLITTEKFIEMFDKKETEMDRIANVLASVNNPTEESPKVETKWQPKRDDRVLVWCEKEELAVERIFFDKAGKNILAMGVQEYDDYINGNDFFLEQYFHMKPLPIEQPTETDFKSKVIELIEKRIEICVESIEEYKNENKFYAAEVWKNCKIENQEILKQIKQL